MPIQWTQYFLDLMEPVDILFKDPRTGNLVTVASGVEMLIIPKSDTDGIEDLDIRPDRHLFDGIFRVTRTDLRKRNNIIRRRSNTIPMSDRTDLVVLRVLTLGDYQRLVLEDRSVQ